uniref:TNF superfamily member 4 n=1 Tax=Homo sapiens TaxID=9606 RepID=A0AAQ5BI34_HUMAN
MERVQPLEENVGNAARPRFERNKLLLVASVIQGLGLLLCFTYICLHFSALQVSHRYPRIQSIKVQFTGSLAKGTCLVSDETMDFDLWMNAEMS